MMACTYCRHFNSDENGHTAFRTGTVVEQVAKETGACTLSPTWQKVTGLHCCSQFSPQRASDVGLFFRNMHEAIDDLEQERKRRIAAEKKLKELKKEPAAV
jgi:hypothetical protein